MVALSLTAPTKGKGAVMLAVGLLPPRRSDLLRTWQVVAPVKRLGARCATMLRVLAFLPRRWGTSTAIVLNETSSHLFLAYLFVLATALRVG